MSTLLRTLASVTLLGLTSCGHTELKPADSALRTGIDSETVIDQAHGVTVRANANTWTGARQLEQEIVPVELAILNESDRKVYFRRSDVALVSGTRRVAALSLDRLRDAREQEVSVGQDPSLADPEGSGDLGFYATSAPDPRPSPALQAMQATIAEGGIRSGTELRGFVFFGDLPRDLEQVNLQVAVREGPEPGAPVVALVNIPFVVDH